ncbi:MAG: hypothetical protein C5B43_04955 [Verrucomicrobia bacterium]|nr:MAG: hypothetical protein C5B43_04955 [Verrucomicrobiota bacterium]
MGIAIIECTADLIIYTSFAKKDESIVLQQQVQKKLQCTVNNWIEGAAMVIKRLITEFKIKFPITIILPDFVLLTRTIKVPKVESSKQKYVIQSHIFQTLGLSGNENIHFVIRSSDENELDVICSIVKQDWMESFVKALSGIGDKILSIQPAILHYYNAFNLLFPLTIKNVLLLVFNEDSLSCLFIGQNNLFIFKIQSADNDIRLSIKELLEFHNNKYPDNIPEEVLIAGININDSNNFLIQELSQYLHLPARIFVPLGEENACCLGSIGYAYAKLLDEGFFLELIPANVLRYWRVIRSKKALFMSGISFVVAACILIVGLAHKQNYYQNLIEAYKTKIIPLRTNASMIEENEWKISRYEEGLSALQNQIQSSYSWVDFLNALQTILIKIPKIQITSLKIQPPEVVENIPWQNAMLGIETEKLRSGEGRLLNLAGILHIGNEDASSRTIIADIKYLMDELGKLDFIEEAKNLHFDVKAAPEVPFSIGFVLKNQTL